MNVVYKKTIELTDKEIEELCFLFYEVFQVSKNVQEFKNEFLNTCLGFSYHGILYTENNEIVGANSYIPFYYYVNNECKLIAVGADTMIRSSYRNFDNIISIISEGRKLLKQDGFFMNIGFPNENSYPLFKKAFRDKEIGNLSIYILPYKIGGIKNELKCFNFLSILFSNILLFLSHFSRNNQMDERIIKRDLDSFEKYRYNWFNPDDYRKSTCDGVTYSYKIKNYEGINCAFVFDVHPLSKKNFDKVIRDLKKKEKKNFSMIMYVGNLNFKPISLIKVPAKMEPKTFHFVGKLLQETTLDEKLLFDVNNWDVDLASYDLI